jgi:long-chain fatty acid transport protein
MKPEHPEVRPSRTTLACALAAATWLAAPAANAGGLSLYEIGTADVGLASAGYTARAQDASTAFTNPAGMTRLEGTQTTLAAQVLYGDLGFSIGQGTSPGLGDANGGNPVGWFPGGGAFASYSVSPDLKLGFAATGNFGLSASYDAHWAGRYYVQEPTLIGLSMVPSVAYRVSPQWSVGAGLNLMYAKMRAQVAINNVHGDDGQLVFSDYQWGVGGNVGVLYEPSRNTRFGFVWNAPVKLDFSAPPQFSGISPLLEAALRKRGLYDANIDLGVTVPQGVDASFLHQVDSRWTLLGSVGWQQWSRFGEVEIGIDSPDPTSLTKNLDFKDTWHVALGAQYQLDSPWRLDFGVAYDSEFQDNAKVSPLLPANSAWRFGFGANRQESRSFSWGLAAEYVYGGTLHVNQVSELPVALGGRGDLVGSYESTGIFFLSANFNWKF